MNYRYPFSQQFNDWKMQEYKKRDGALVLWGAGKIGGVAAHCLKKRGIHFEAFCDIAKDKWGGTFCDHKIISPEELKKSYPDATVLITNVFDESVRQWLFQNGFSTVLDCVELFMEIDFEGYDFWMEPQYAIRNVEQYLAAILEQNRKSHQVDQIFLNITTKCTLRCRDCSMFIPYVSSPRNYDVDHIMNDFFRVIDALEHVRVVNFYGGEPFLHPQLSDMIRQLSGDKRISRISAITNGTLMPDPSLLSAMAEESRFLLRISDYGQLSSKLDELKEKLEEYHIQYEVANYTYWDQPSKIQFLDSQPETLAAKFRDCTACNVIFLLNRRAYLCSTASAVCNLGGFPSHENNYLMLSDEFLSEKEFKAMLNKFLDRKKNNLYFDACRYCSGNHCVQFENKVPVAVQAKELLTFSKLY